MILLYNIADCIRGVGSGTIRGLGWQMTGAYITFFCYWIVGLTASVFMGFNYNKGVPGMWFAFALAAILYVLIQYGAIEAFYDWPDFRKHKD